ncbi:MAG TPA: LamG domain-containing protein [Blastocatellia bacterium]
MKTILFSLFLLLMLLKVDSGYVQSTLNTCVPAPSRMVAWWPLDETTGTTAKDIVGGNNGTYNSSSRPVPVPGKVAGALQFDELDFVQAPRTIPTHDYRDLTLDAWIYPDDINTGLEMSVVQYDTFLYGLISVGNELLFFTQSPPTFFSVTSSGANIAAGTWTHVAVTADASTHKISFYVNGNLVTTSPPIYNPTSLFEGTGWSIGGGPFEQFFGGKIDEVEVFERALSPQEIKDIFLADSHGKCKCVTPPNGLVNWWPFDEKLNPLARDISQFPNDATPFNGPVTAPGKVARALCFNGTGAYAVVKNHPEVDFPSDCSVDAGVGFTIDLWVKTTASKIQVILDKRQVAFNFIKGYHLFISDGRLGFQMATGPGNAICNSPGSACDNYVSPPGFPNVNLRDGEWHFIAVTVINCRISEGKMYVDGRLVHTFRPRSESIGNKADLSIGRRSAGDDKITFNGCVDELEFFDTVLSEAEISAIYNAGVLGKCKP